MSSNRNSNYRRNQNNDRGSNGGSGGGPRHNQQHQPPQPQQPRAGLIDYSQEWLMAIQNAMLCLHNNNNNNNSNRSYHSNTRGSMDDGMIQASIQYLNLCEAQLLVKERKWHLPPNFLPPTWDTIDGNAGGNVAMGGPSHVQQQQQQQLVGYYPNYSNVPQHPPASIAVNNHSNNMNVNSSASSAALYGTNTTSTKTSNRYGALLQDDDSDEDDDDDDDDDEVELGPTGGIDDDDDDEGGDQVTFHPQQQQQQQQRTTKKVREPYIYGMDMRRIMIRIYDAQSGCYAAQALICRKNCHPPQWNEGATKYTYCLHKIHAALNLADSEISKWISFAYGNNNNNSNSSSKSMYMNQIVPLLQQDAEIVNVAVESMTSNRDAYIKAAKLSEEALLRKLEPQWSSRDEVKNRMGVQKWKNNPNPKNDYVEQRIVYEQELKDIRLALQCLIKLDTISIMVSAKQLHEKIVLGQYSESVTPMLSTPTNFPNDPTSDAPPPQQQQQQQQYYSNHQRYNGIRPTDVSRRVDLRMYPDPTVYGWTFTGSCEASFVEFFEKTMENSSNNSNDPSNNNNNNSIIKLDWYYTTGTIKTSLFHPNRNKHTQLFGSQVNPDTYQHILQNPRTHTGQRYHHRNNRPPLNNDGGGGRGRGRGYGQNRGRGGRGDGGGRSNQENRR